MGIEDIHFAWAFLCLLPLVAFLYASVGHGGASGYLGLMAIFSVPVPLMKPSALLLNICVAGISFLLFLKRGHFKWSLFWPFAISSIPFSFVGGYLNVDATLYKQILAVLLIFAVLRILGIFNPTKHKEHKKLNLFAALLMGAAIGLFSGMIGIGGGIILSPIILLLHWGQLKETAAVSALFIWVNSCAGMAGLIHAGVEFQWTSIIMVAIAVIGGLIGGYVGSHHKMNNKPLLYILAAVLLVASIKLLFV